MTDHKRPSARKGEPTTAPTDEQPVTPARRELSAALRKLRAQQSGEAPTNEPKHEQTAEPTPSAAEPAPDVAELAEAPSAPQQLERPSGSAQARLRAQRAAAANGKFTDEPGFESLAPAARVDYEARRLAALRMHAEESREHMRALQGAATRIQGLVSAERERLAEHEAAVHRAALADSELPVSPVSNLPALERAASETQAKLTTATQMYELDERRSRDHSRFEQAQRAVVLADAKDFAAAKISPLVAELQALLASVPGTHMFNVGGASPLTVEIASPDQPPPPVEFRVGSIHLQKLRDQRAAKEALAS